MYNIYDIVLNSKCSVINVPESASRAKDCEAPDTGNLSKGCRSRATKQTKAPASYPGT